MSSSPKLNADNTNRVQSINGNFICYAHAINPTILPALNEIPNWKSAPTQYTLTKCNQVLDYAATNPHVTIRYHASDMILITDTNSAYIVLTYARSLIADHYYLTDRMLDYSKGNPTPNGLILT